MDARPRLDTGFFGLNDVGLGRPSLPYRYGDPVYKLHRNGIVHSIREREHHPGSTSSLASSRRRRPRAGSG